MRSKFISAILITVFLLSWATPARAAVPSPGLCKTKTDMQLAYVGSIPTNYQSRTRLPEYAKIPGGQTPATMRLRGGVGNVQLPAKWQNYVWLVNGKSDRVLKYLFHRNSGWQNADQYARVEEVVFENAYVAVTRIVGERAYVLTFSTSDDVPPTPQSPSMDARTVLFTVVTRENTIVGSPVGNAYIILIARPGEQLWLPVSYLDCPPRTLPVAVTVQTGWSTLNIRSTPGGQWMGSYASGASVAILELATDASGALWGRTDQGWIALRYTSWYG